MLKFHHLSRNTSMNIDVKTFLNNYVDKNFSIGYARQSTVKQKSLDEQISEIKNRARLDGFEYMITFSSKGSSFNISNIYNLKFQFMTKLIPTIRNILNSNLYLKKINIFTYTFMMYPDL